ncbi:alpha/beta hydrolase [Streptomyces formicae]|uniref:Putative exported protease n=1 Tax=Streptomyces formicae TaxID=1616117 RepID=A0A291QME0_9ACTN|nr:alpha/beta hydrolase [Streptomyces formicae]ATL32676.1 putative exported protease [Streptomyces formicae]
MQHFAYRRRLVPLLALGVVAGLVPGLVAGAAAAAPGQTAARQGDASARQRGADTRQLAAYTRQKLSWKRCADDKPAVFQCATLKVPLDYRVPEGRRIDVAISRIRTSDPGKRRGILTMNPGGPGGPGLELPVEAADGLPKALLDQYDLVGFDPRGVGRSTPVSCGLTRDELPYPRVTRSTADAVANEAWARGFAAKCRAAAGDRLPYNSTRNTARDMDVMRAVLGEKKLTYYGVSYGTALGAVYMQLFPHRVDRFVLDSAVDPGRMWRGMFRIWGPEGERAFQRWTKWTADRDRTYHLGASPAAVARSFWRLVARADTKPIVFGEATLDGPAVRDLLRPELYSVRKGAEAVAMLKRAADGQSVPGLPAEESSENEIASQTAVLCADAPWPRDPGVYRRDAFHDAARHPLYGDFAASIIPCAYWPKGAEPATTVDNDVTSLIVQNEWDPQTPLTGARAMHRALKGSRMVTVDEGEGHGVVFGDTRNTCAENAALGYLATGGLPDRDVTCHATPGRRGIGR